MLARGKGKPVVRVALQLHDAGFDIRPLGRLLKGKAAVDEKDWNRMAQD